MKICIDCKVEKNIEDFSKDKYRIDNRSPICKSCSKSRHSKWKLDKDNAEKYKLYQKELYSKNSDKYKDYQKKYRINNLNKVRLQKQSYYKRNKVKIYSQENLAKINERVKLRALKDPEFRLIRSLRSRIRIAIVNGGGFKRGKSEELLGCSFQEVRKHLESLFQPGMTWENHGMHNTEKPTWHIDHILPCSSFDLTKEDEQKKCFHYTNLQPLWAKDNLIKHDRLDWIPSLPNSLDTKPSLIICQA